MYIPNTYLSSAYSPSLLSERDLEESLLHAGESVQVQTKHEQRASEGAGAVAAVTGFGQNASTHSPPLPLLRKCNKRFLNNNTYSPTTLCPRQ